METTNEKIQQLKNLDKQLEEGQKKLSGWQASLVNVDEAIKSGEIINSLDEINLGHGRVGTRYF